VIWIRRGEGGVGPRGVWAIQCPPAPGKRTRQGGAEGGRWGGAADPVNECCELAPGRRGSDGGWCRWGWRSGGRAITRILRRFNGGLARRLVAGTYVSGPAGLEAGGAAPEAPPLVRRRRVRPAVRPARRPPARLIKWASFLLHCVPMVRHVHRLRSAVNAIGLAGPSSPPLWSSEGETVTSRCAR
jgi:hypothetical protein